MKIVTGSIVLFIILLLHTTIYSQDQNTNAQSGGWFSLGVRSTFSFFDHDGSGLGTGGQFRIQLSNSVNTDWFADYITINISDKVRSEYYHIGWSVLYYPFKSMQYPKVFKPYVLAGHCFDYNRKTVIEESSISKSRWGSAVQAGVGTHINLNERFDISLTCQYMMHLTTQLEAIINGSDVTIRKDNGSSIEGHLLATASLNYKLFQLWKK